MEGLAQEVSEENISMSPRDSSYDILEKKKKKMAGFYPCLKCLSEAKWKSCGLIVLADNVSKQPVCY